MATLFYKHTCLCFGIIYFILLFSFLNCDKTFDNLSDEEKEKIRLRNIASDDIQSMFNNDGSLTDTRQDPVTPRLIGGIDIAKEAAKFSLYLRWLSNEEIRTTYMQVYKSERNPMFGTFHKLVQVLKMQVFRQRPPASQPHGRAFTPCLGGPVFDSWPCQTED